MGTCLIDTVGRWDTYREHHRDTSADSLAPIQGCLLAQPQVLCLAAIALPAGNRGAVQQHLDAFARRQRCDDLLARARAHDIDLRCGAGGRRRIDGRGAIGAVGHCVVAIWEDGGSRESKLDEWRLEVMWEEVVVVVARSLFKVRRRRWAVYRCRCEAF